MRRHALWAATASAAAAAAVVVVVTVAGPAPAAALAELGAADATAATPVSVAALDAAAAAAHAAASPALAGAPPAVRQQVRTAAGLPCDTDDDCGGYAVQPYLWCRAGFGSAAKTCRSYVAMGDKCDTTALVCPRHPYDTSEDASEIVECRSGTCREKQRATELGAECYYEIGCAGDLSCSRVADRSRKCVRSSLGYGDTCGSELLTCGYRYKCATPAGVCTSVSECPGDGPPTCEPILDGDPCGTGTPIPYCPGLLYCINNTCTARTVNGVGGACGSFARQCQGGLTCATANGTVCGFSDCGEGFSGTCRLPRLGDDCGRSNGCAFGDSGLSCAPVEVVTDGSRTYGRSACIRAKAPGAGCDLTGAENICGTDDNGDWQLCLGGVCSASPNGAVVGDQCTRAQCADGSACVYNLALTGLPVAVCANASRGAGDSCVPPGTRGTNYCDPGALLTCVNGTCVAPDAKPAERQACDPTKREPCADTKEADGSKLVCRWVPDVDVQAGGRSECRFQRGEAGACQDVNDCLGGFAFQCVDGMCTEFAEPPKAAKNETCRNDDRCGPGLVCLAPNSRARWDRVCVTNVTVGGACNYEYEQCAGGLCNDGVCEAKVAPGGACTIDYQCGPDHSCWRGFGATGQTCRKWVGFNQECKNTYNKCWRQLTCTDEGLCKNPTEANVAGSVCEADGDCAGDNFVCRIESGFSTLRICRKLVEPDEQCRGRFEICQDGFECTYRGFEDQRCLKWVPRKAPCGGPGVRCWVDLKCSSAGICENAVQRPGNRGGQCDDDTECGDGLTCVAQEGQTISRCQEVAGPTENCKSRDNHRVCGSGFKCTWRRGATEPVCLKFVPPGGDCSGGVGVSCWNGSTCEDKDGAKICSRVL